MEIKTGKEIVAWTRGKSISELNIEPYNKKWVAIDDLIKEIDKHANCSEYHMVGLLKFTCLDVIKGKLLGFDAITSTSHNTDYDFGSGKEPQPKGKDASHPSHNQ